jgi:hypothetical protein
MLYMDIIVIYYEIHTKHKYPHDRRYNLLVLNLAVYKATTRLENVNHGYLFIQRCNCKQLPTIKFKL